MKAVYVPPLGPRARCIAGSGEFGGCAGDGLVPHRSNNGGIELPEEMVIDGRDLAPMIKGESRVVPAPGLKQSLNATVPLRRSWDPPHEWDQLIKRHEYNDAFFYHGSEGTLAGGEMETMEVGAHTSLQLFDLQTDPGESVPVPMVKCFGNFGAWQFISAGDDARRPRRNRFTQSGFRPDHYLDDGP